MMLHTTVMNAIIVVTFDTHQSISYPLQMYNLPKLGAFQQFSQIHQIYVIGRIGLLHLKSIHPLWKILEKCTTGGSVNFQMHILFV